MERHPIEPNEASPTPEGLETGRRTLGQSAAQREQGTVQGVGHALEDGVGRLVARTGAKFILVGFSGGADSMALLSILASLAKRKAVAGLRIKAVHCNFQLRGEESLRDEEFCRQRCREVGIELEVARFDTLAHMRRTGQGLEEACRELRYALFRRLMSREGWERVAVAHHADDNAETLLLNLMRGSGSRGLKGMEQDSGGILRPLLHFPKEAILSYLAEKGLDYVTDSTNAESDCRRNFLRNEVLPLLETRWPQARRVLARSAELLADESRIIDEATSCPDGRLPMSRLSASPSPLTLLHRFLSPLGGSPSQAREMLRAVEQRAGDAQATQSGAVWRLPGGRVSLERDCLELLPSEPVPLAIIEQVKVALDEAAWKRIRANRDQSVAWFPQPLERYEVRRRQEGDRLTPAGGHGKTTVAKLMKDQGLSRREKEATPLLLTPEGEVAWVAGLRRGAADLLPPGATEAWEMRVQTPKANARPK